MPVSPEAMAKHAADTALAGQFDDLLQRARDAESALRQAQAARAPGPELHTLGTRLDADLTEVMRAAFAAERAEIGPHILKSAAILIWILAGWALVRR